MRFLFAPSPNYARSLRLEAKPCRVVDGIFHPGVRFLRLRRKPNTNDKGNKTDLPQANTHCVNPVSINVTQLGDSCVNQFLPGVRPASPPPDRLRLALCGAARESHTIEKRVPLCRAIRQRATE